MKIQLPNPYDSTVEQWFVHMRIVLKAAEKTYQQMVIDHGGKVDEDGDHNPWIQFRLGDELQKDIENGACAGIDDVLPRNLYLEIDRLS